MRKWCFKKFQLRTVPLGARQNTRLISVLISTPRSHLWRLRREGKGRGRRERGVWASARKRGPAEQRDASVCGVRTHAPSRFPNRLPGSEPAKDKRNGAVVSRQRLRTGIRAQCGERSKAAGNVATRSQNIAGGRRAQASGEPVHSRIPVQL